VTVFGIIGKYWIKSTSLFDDDCRKASIRFSKFQTVWVGLRHRIAHAPEDGVNSGLGDGMLIMKVSPDAEWEAPGIAVLYKYDTTTVYLIRLIAQEN